MKRLKKLLGALIFVMVFTLSCPISFQSNITTVEAAVKINTKSTTIIKGQKTTLKVTGTKKVVKWSSSNKSIATVTSKGVVTGKKKGTATITAKVGNKKYTCKVKVETPVINKKSATLLVNQSLTLKISGTTQKVTWKSSDKSIATVNSSGKVTAKKTGSITITATILKKNYTCKIKVENPSISKKKVDLAVGKTLNLKLNGTTQKVTWKSSDKSIATVNSSGKVTAKKPGQVKITGTVLNKNYICTIDVYEAFSSSKAKENIVVTSTKMDDGVIVFLENKNSCNISVEMTCVYYDEDGNLLSKNGDDCYAFKAGSKIALFANKPYDSNYESVEYSRYKIYLDVEKESESIINNTNGINCNANFGADNVMVEVENTGKNGAEFTHIAVVFYKNGKAIGYEDQYAEVEDKGDIDILEFDFPYDSNYDTIYPDDFEVFVNGSYGYDW